MKTRSKNAAGLRSLRRHNPAMGVAVLRCLGIMVIGLAALSLGCDDEKAAADPCAVCQADQLCVQINDSSGLCKSSTPTIDCRTVSAECRAAITAEKSCKTASSACMAELCMAPYQCHNNSPCGNETPMAQLYCYGP
jgi:hypothetical protein